MGSLIQLSGLPLHHQPCLLWEHLSWNFSYHGLFIVPFLSLSFFLHNGAKTSVREKRKRMELTYLPSNQREDTAMLTMMTKSTMTFKLMSQVEKIDLIIILLILKFEQV